MNITKKIITALVFLVFIICITKISYASTAIVTADLLNLRESPSTSAKIKLTINKNQELEVIGQDGVWYKVKINNTEGYVHGDYIKIKEESKVEEKENTPVNNEEEKTSTEVDNKLPETITVSKEINIYILPLINSNKISATEKNETITILGSTNKWLYVSAKKVNGWVLRSSVLDNTSTNTSTNTNTNANTNANENTNTNTNNNTNTFKEKTMYVNSASIYVRKGPGTNYDYIDTLVLNNSVTVIGEEKDWYKVKVDGKEGYIAKFLLSDTKKEVTSRGEASRTVESNNKSEIVENTQVNVQTEETTINKVENTTTLGEQIVEYAKQYLGCKYVYGGSGPTTFDCSGFTMYVYKKFGINLSHSAVTQSKNGTYVAKEDLKPGDLVFFKNYDTMEGIGHCGIYIGNGDFIHASSGTGYCVKISTLLTGHYETRYETARRII